MAAQSSPPQAMRWSSGVDAEGWAWGFPGGGGRGSVGHIEAHTRGGARRDRWWARLDGSACRPLEVGQERSSVAVEGMWR